LPRKPLQLVLTFHFYIFLVLFLKCTENPFDDKKQVSNNIISGKVELWDGLNPKDVFIWFRPLDISTRTDEEGCFKLALPSPNKQPGGGLDGVYYLYFYVANYNLDSVEVALQFGNLRISNENMNNDGELKGVIQLTKLIDIKVSIEPGSISSSSFNDTVFTHVTIHAFDIDNKVPLIGKFSRKEGKYDPIFLAGILIDSTKNFVKIVKREERAIVNHSMLVNTTPTTLDRMMLKYKPGMLSPGNYEIIPCLLIRQKLPLGLLESIGENIESLGQEYLNIPLKVKGSQFHVFE